MLPTFALLLLQGGMSAQQPGYFAPVLLGSLLAGGIGWLIAAVLGFARARAFGASTRWFSLAAVCLVIFHIQFLLLGIVAVLALLTATLVALFAPHQPPQKGASPMTELGALENRDVLLTLAIGAIGFGGLFTVYTYLANTLLSVTRVQEGVVPLVFALFGAGMMSGLGAPRAKLIGSIGGTG